MDRTTFTSCVHNYRDMVYGHAWYFFGNSDDAADTTQEVFMKLWQHRNTIDMGTVKSWLMKVARNQCIDHLRKKKERLIPEANMDGVMTDVRYEMVSHSGNPEQEMMADDTKRQLIDGIRNLPSALRSVLIMREIQHHSYNEIALALNISLASVKVQLHRARRMLLTHLTMHTPLSAPAGPNRRPGLSQGEQV